MTLREAVQELKDIRDNKNFPFYLKHSLNEAIETIEIERADAMDKQILVDLDALLELKVQYGETEYHFDHYAIPVDEIEDALKDGTLKVIDAVPQWIPVSEKLPNELERVLITVRYSNDRKDRVVQVGSGYIDRFGDWIWHYTEEYGLCKSKVLAWMPLPEPYKGGTR